MKEKEYNFIELNCRDKVDPVFNDNNYKVFGDASIYGGPRLYWAYGYSYLFVNPNEIINNKELLFKIGAYLYHHETKDENNWHTYFFGDLNKAQEIGNGFTNQVCEYVSIEMVEDWFPKNISKINEYVIAYFLKQQEYYGQEFNIKDGMCYYNLHYIYFIPTSLSLEKYTSNKNFIESQLFEKGYFIKKRENSNELVFTLSEKAIDMFEKSQKVESNCAFIAIKFGENNERIEAIKKTIRKAGYEPQILRDVETNNWIMPEIFHDIETCKFMVADFSILCEGAYYEAGYAQALKKEVIHLCEQQYKDKLHFDIAQKSTILYDNMEDLENKLYARIKATIK